jgi:hypothetical protein
LVTIPNRRCSTTPVPTTTTIPQTRYGTAPPAPAHPRAVTPNTVHGTAPPAPAHPRAITPNTVHAPVATAITAGRRANIPTARATAANQQVQQAQAYRLAARDQRVRRTEARIIQADLNATVEQAGDSDELRRLKGMYFILVVLNDVFTCHKGSFSKYVPRGMFWNVDAQH